MPTRYPYPTASRSAPSPTNYALARAPQWLVLRPCAPKNFNPTPKKKKVADIYPQRHLGATRDERKKRPLSFLPIVHSRNQPHNSPSSCVQDSQLCSRSHSFGQITPFCVLTDGRARERFTYPPRRTTDPPPNDSAMCGISAILVCHGARARAQCPPPSLGCAG